MEVTGGDVVQLWPQWLPRPLCKSDIWVVFYHLNDKKEDHMKIWRSSPSIINNKWDGLRQAQRVHGPERRSLWSELRGPGEEWRKI